MTVDILKERLAAYEPLRYDYDPFDPDGRFARQAERASRRKNPQYGSYATRKDRCKEHVYDYPHHCKPSLSRSSSFGSGHGRASLDGSWMSSHPPLGHGINPLGRSYTSKLQGTSSQTTPTHRSCSTSVFDDDDEDDTFTFLADIDDSVSEGYTSADERMFLTPRLSPFLSRRRSTSSLAALRPILRRHNPSGGRRSGMRGRRVSFEDELDVGDVGIDMFRTEPGFMSPTYR